MVDPRHLASEVKVVAWHDSHVGRWGSRRKGSSVRARSPVESGREAVRAVEVLIAALTALSCLVINAAADRHIEPLSRENLGPFALAYHNVRPPLALLAVVLFLPLLAPLLRGVARAAVLVFIGAAAANIVSPLVWGGSVPNYIVLQKIDVVMNVSDALMLGSAVVIVVSIALAPWRRTRRRDLTSSGSS
jgi:hypothetical protein